MHRSIDAGVVGARVTQECCKPVGEDCALEDCHCVTSKIHSFVLETDETDLVAKDLNEWAERALAERQVFLGSELPGSGRRRLRGDKPTPPPGSSVRNARRRHGVPLTQLSATSRRR
jgi:hypothetical protein